MNTAELKPEVSVQDTSAPAGTSAGGSEALSYFQSVKKHLRARAIPTLKYMAETECHTYAFSVAANAILSFIPAIVLMATITRLVFHSRPMLDVIFFVVERYLPIWNYADKMWVMRNLKVMVYERHSIQLMSLVMLLISSTGIFEPLEVALNKVWGFTANRSYIKNQIVSLGLTFGCGALAMISVALTSGTQLMVAALIPHNLSISFVNTIFVTAATAVTWIIMKFFALLTTIAIFFFIYWILPNGKVKARQVFPAAVVTGVLLEVAKYIYMAVLPLLDFEEAYGPFKYSVTLIFWAFTAGMLLLGGAYLSASEKESETPPSAAAKGEAAKA
ncbi:MAG TPA: YihY/virulence factor BrkB family protein [Terriglobales bacterium]|nr:YihY/virulence factor BrkB family protein [Terriglobales bacterium]